MKLRWQNWMERFLLAGRQMENMFIPLLQNKEKMEAQKTVWFDGNVKQVNRKQFIPGQDMQCFYSWKQRRVVGYLFMFVRIIITQNWFF